MKLKNLEYKVALRMVCNFSIIGIKLLFGPVAFALFMPLILLNFPVRFLAPLFNPKLGKKLTHISAMAASDDIYGRPLFTVLLNYFVDGDIDLEAHRQMFQLKVVDALTPDGRRYRYPELRQYITTTWGYKFWHQDEKFDIDNHIRLCEKNDYFDLAPGQDLDEQAVMKATNDILVKPFHAKRSPWEILIFRDAKSKSPTSVSASDKQSLVIFRYHHAMSDGYSVTKLMANVTTGDYFQSPLIQQKVSWWRHTMEVAFYPLMAVFVFAFYLSNYIDKNKWSFVVNFDDNDDNKDKCHSNKCSKQIPAKKIRDAVYVTSDPIPIDKIKAIKRQRSASFNGVVLQGVTSGIRKYFLKNGPLPDAMHVALSVPVPGHPDCLTNHWTACFLRLPLEVSSPQRRLEMIQHQFMIFETKLMSKVPYLGTIYSGNLSNTIITHVMRYTLQPSTITMSIFPGPENLQLLTGEKILGGGFVLGPMGNQGVCVTVVSCNGAMRVFFGIEKSLLTKEEDAQEIVRNMANDIIIG